MNTKQLFNNKWISLHDIDGYVFSHETRCNGNIVAVLGYKGDKFLGRFENTPSHSDDIELCSLTGGIDKGNTPTQTAVIELEEEAGIKKEEKDFKSLGTVRPSKSSDTTVHLFAIDCNDVEIGEIKGDGSEGEKGSYCKWVTKEELINCKDPLVHTMLLRL